MRSTSWLVPVFTVCIGLLVGCSDDDDRPSNGVSGMGGTVGGSGGGTTGGSAETGGDWGSEGTSETGGVSEGGSTAETGGVSEGGSTAETGGDSGGGGTDEAGGVSGGGQGGDAGTGGTQPGSPPVIGDCTVFTADDDWNRDISSAPVDATWTSNVQAAFDDVNLHPDFGNWDNREWGIPINIVPENQPMLEMDFEWWPEESDPGPYPFPGPDEARIEGGDAYDCTGDCHLITVQQGTCMVYESGNCTFEGDVWHCSCGAIWDLSRPSYGQRPMGWTSADAAGLSIVAGLIRYDEVQAGEIRHAIRFTLPCTRSDYVRPATHFAVPGNCSDDPSDPPMGLRVRLRADYDISSFNQTAQVILMAMKRYGMILADNGSAFYFQAETNPGWNGDEQQLKDVPASAFEVVQL